MKTVIFLKKNSGLPEVIFPFFANKSFRYIFETLPIATRLSPEPIDFIFTETFGKGPKLGLCCRKVEKVGNIDNFVLKFEEFYFPFFTRFHFEV